MNDLTDLKDEWSQPDPPSPSARLAARAALLREIDAARAPVRRRRRVRLGWLASGTAVAAMAAAAVAVAMALGSTPPTQPEPPAGQASGQPASELSGPQILLNAAVVAQSQPASTGAYWQVTEQAPVPDTPKPIQTVNEWTSRDGMHYSLPDGGTGAYRVMLDVGFWAGPSLLTLEQLERLPTDPDALKAWMTDSYLHPRRHDTSGPVPPDGNTVEDLPPGELSLRVADGLSRLLWTVPTAPAVRSAALRALATMPNVTNLGNTDGGQVLRMTFEPPAADKFPGGKLPPGSGEITMVIDPETSMMVSWTNYQGTIKVLKAAWTNDAPKIIPAPTK
ncbi:MAG: hypothetical protein ACJ72N_20410 [Labedaea sp.]